MGCCLDKPESERLKEEENFKMPYDGGKRGHGESSHARPAKSSRKYQETTYEIRASQWDQMVTDRNSANANIQQRDNEIQNLKREITSLKQEKDALLTRAHGKIQQKDHEIQNLKREITTLTQEKDALLTRVSQIAGANLLNNNPNIADLTDPNRPTKLAEHYSELYDNEWTDAFAEQEDMGVEVQGAAERLRDMMTDIYKLCDETASRQREMLDSSLKQFTKNKDVSVELIKQLKENRKKNYKDFLPELTEAVNKKLTAKYKDVMNKDKIRAYKNKSLELCWLMCIQDPPVYMDCELPLHGQEFDKAKYKAYTTTGPLVDFAVWPPLYIQKGGNMLSKGTAQGLNPPRIA